MRESTPVYSKPSHNVLASGAPTDQADQSSSTSTTVLTNSGCKGANRKCCTALSRFWPTTILKTHFTDSRDQHPPASSLSHKSASQVEQPRSPSASLTAVLDRNTKRRCYCLCALLWPSVGPRNLFCSCQGREFSESEPLCCGGFACLEFSCESRASTVIEIPA